MSALTKTSCVALIVVGVTTTGLARPADVYGDVATSINNANALLRSGDVPAALKAYESVQQTAPDSADLSYDLGVAQYRKGDLAAAERNFSEAAGANSDLVATKARYNLGNCSYAQALQLAEKDHAAAIAGFNKAISSYRSALELDPADVDARANIELASAMIDRLRQQDQQEQNQQKNQQQNQKQDQKESQKDQKQSGQHSDKSQKRDQQQIKSQQQSENKDKTKNDSQQQSGAQDQKKNGSEGQPSGKQSDQQSGDEPKQSKSSPRPDSKAQDSKSQPGEQQKGESNQSHQRDSQNRSQPSSDDKQSKSAEQAQQNASQQKDQQTSAQRQANTQRSQLSDPGQLSEPKEQQGTAAPKGALSATEQKVGVEKQQEGQADGPFETAVDGPMTKQEAEKMLQAIRDQEMLRRLRRQAVERNQHIPVDRDW